MIGVVIVAVGQVVAWARNPGLGLLAVLGGVLGVVTCALLIRVCCTVGSRLIGPDRSRDAGWLVALVIIALSIPTVALLLRVDWLDPQGAEMQRVADVAGWTPWGAAWAVPAEVASGHVGTGVVKLLVAVAVVALLAWAWWALVSRALETVDDRARTRRYQGLGWFDRFGSAPVSAVAARALTYWVRDPRYRTSYLIILLVPIVVIPLGVAGVPWQWTALVPLPLMALIAGFLPHNDVSYDNTAVWLHVASGAPGWSDRLGRVVPVLVVGAPAIVAGAALSAWLFGDRAAFPLLIGVSASALLSGLGLSSVVSVLMPYPTVRPGDHPFQQPQAAGVTATVAQATMVIGIVLCTVPAVCLAVLAAVQGPGLVGADAPGGRRDRCRRARHRCVRGWTPVRPPWPGPARRGPAQLGAHRTAPHRSERRSATDGTAQRTSGAPEGGPSYPGPMSMTEPGGGLDVMDREPREAPRRRSDRTR